MIKLLTSLSLIASFLGITPFVFALPSSNSQESLQLKGSEESPITYNYNNRRLYAETCEELQAFGKYLIDWKQLNDGEIQIKPITCLKDRRERYPYSIDISDLLPRRAQQILNAQTRVFGPNCIGASLYANGFVGGFRYFSSKSFIALLGLSQCHIVSSKDYLRPGDMIVFYSRDQFNGLVANHSAITISPQIVFEKKSADPDYVEFQTLSNNLKLYRITEECHKVESTTPESSCENFTVIYRCSNQKEVKRDIFLQIAELDPLLANVIREFDSLEKQVMLTGYIEKTKRSPLLTQIREQILGLESQLTQTNTETLEPISQRNRDILLQNISDLNFFLEIVSSSGD
jgi:hypothetical protein